ncbi:solute carrier family 29 (equilibrative nucleoside transporter), member 1/2/3 [Schistosoma bovis]|uniref:Solute carrier family 29 (Equilibrative nucleoside transporter), member 1/2/3 n=1 Tax=Schistosoma bovis TaxID=6184 RepID=A0A430Q8A7_SCHBO|nr:solute carrier family 29 (equilibrative nucleoside transporter), member 1/2/3 [Schistosoma bovis]
MTSGVKDEKGYSPTDRYSEISITVPDIIWCAYAFLSITLISVVFLNCNLFSFVIRYSIGGSALAQGSVFGVAAILPSKHMKAALEGQAVSGILASLANIVSIAASSSATTNGLVYFLVALVFVTATAALFLVLPKNGYFKYYWDKKDSPDKNNIESDPSLKGVTNDCNESQELVISINKSGILSTMKETFLPGICVLITLMITLSLFPAVVARIRPITVIPQDLWTNVYFVPVLVYLLYNVGDWCGRMLAGLIKWPRRNQMLIVLLLCVLRAAIIPLCMLCNAQPRNYLPVIFKHDIFPAFMILFLGLTNGYLVSISMIHGPRQVFFASPGNQESAGAALSIYLSFGLSLGVAISVGLVQGL